MCPTCVWREVKVQVEHGGKGARDEMEYKNVLWRDLQVGGPSTKQISDYLLVEDFPVSNSGLALDTRLIHARFRNHTTVCALSCRSYLLSRLRSMLLGTHLCSIIRRVQFTSGRPVVRSVRDKRLLQVRA